VDTQWKGGGGNLAAPLMEAGGAHQGGRKKPLLPASMRNTEKKKKGVRSLGLKGGRRKTSRMTRSFTEDPKPKKRDCLCQSYFRKRGKKNLPAIAGTRSTTKKKGGLNPDWGEGGGEERRSWFNSYFGRTRRREKDTGDAAIPTFLGWGEEKKKRRSLVTSHLRRCNRKRKKGLFTGFSARRGGGGGGGNVLFLYSTLLKKREQRERGC